ncbi:hypothetical protein CONPUDRAFT_138223 [Coniophora puteana RWD-64-598 SS2]|uniref:Uncharacterized protein n=1 Tax=Coniophora puteana (strain RWD-64-598) TaxID=741705 RepID=A0A5M3MI90_CONPW|nr:uncharacterized protein CONPUDRAFT_138223 [Coniophora puteana RWD-64-598 SS2]EIW78959.1 hypothetical protein CONPUDRAFT_138223 [Coniophora puteana RWD-64-598 SS2]
MNLNISTYRPISGSCNLTPTVLLDALYEFMEGNRFGVDLAIDDVAFDNDSESNKYDDTNNGDKDASQSTVGILDKLDNNYITLRSLSYLFLQAFFDRYVPERSYVADGGTYFICLSNCSIDGNLIIRTAPGLRLERIKTADEIARALAGWSGTELEIDDCPAFDDAFVDRLRSAEWWSQSAVIECLRIWRCPGISPGALYRLLDERDMHVWDLFVWGASVPITDEEEEAFRELVVDKPRAWWTGRFIWNTA